MMNSLQITCDITWDQFEKNLKGQENIILTDAPSRSFWSRIFSKSSPVAEKVAALIKEKLKGQLDSHWGVTYAPGEEWALDVVFNQLLAESGVSYDALRTVNAAERVFKKIDEGFFVLGGSIPDVYSEGLLLSPGGSPEADAKNVVKLLMGASFNRTAVSWRLLSAVFISKNNKRMQALKNELERVSKVLCEQHLSSCSPAQERLIEIFLGNILALYPFTEPENGSDIIVPQKIEGRWKLVNYQVEVLPLTPRWLSDPVPAFGLKPQGEPNAAPLLLFRGTPHPTASGALSATLSDIVPGHSVGEVIYEHAKELIQLWIQGAHKEFGGVKVYGQSLGGSLSLLAVSRQPEMISEVHAYGSPSLLSNSTSLYEERSKACGAKKPQVNIYWNHGDSVPLVGTGFHRDWHVNKVVIPSQQNGIASHAGLNSSQTRVVVLRMDPELDSKTTARRIFNIFHQVMSVLLVPLSVSLLVFAVFKVAIKTACYSVYCAAKNFFDSHQKQAPLIRVT